jgi:hypothetical protein
VNTFIPFAKEMNLPIDLLDYTELISQQ